MAESQTFVPLFNRHPLVLHSPPRAKDSQRTWSSSVLCSLSQLLPTTNVPSHASPYRRESSFARSRSIGRARLTPLTCYYTVCYVDYGHASWLGLGISGYGGCFEGEITSRSAK